MSDVPLAIKFFTEVWNLRASATSDRRHIFEALATTIMFSCCTRRRKVHRCGELSSMGPRAPRCRRQRIRVLRGARGNSARIHV